MVLSTVNLIFLQPRLNGKYKYDITYISLCLLLDIPMEHLEHGKNTVVPVYMYLKSRLSMVFPIIDSPMAVKFASPTVVI
jgi:hypothetical protein